MVCVWILRYLHGNPFLLGLHEQQLEKVYCVVGFEAAEAGHVVVRTGDEGDKFYLITKVCLYCCWCCWAVGCGLWAVDYGDGYSLLMLHYRYICTFPHDPSLPSFCLHCRERLSLHMTSWA